MRNTIIYDKIEMMNKTKNKPAISILMPVYNAESFLSETLDSVLRQTFEDFELLAINDGSTDKSGVILDKYANLDSRIVVIHKKNEGLVATLNYGIGRARAELIARLDADDPSFEDRFEQQLILFKSNKKLVLVGGGFEIIDHMGYFLETIHPPTQDRDLRRTLYLRNPFGHSGIMFKKEAVIRAGLYTDEFGPTEDYDLWIRLAKEGELACLPFPIYKYRINKGGISQSNSTRQAAETAEHSHRQWSESLPAVLTRRELIDQSESFIRNARTHRYGIGQKEQFLSDNAQVGVKFIRYHHYLKGLRQLFLVASTGRTGIRVIVKRLKRIDRGSLKQDRKLSNS